MTAEDRTLDDLYNELAVQLGVSQEVAEEVLPEVFLEVILYDRRFAEILVERLLARVGN